MKKMLLMAVSLALIGGVCVRADDFQGETEQVRHETLDSAFTSLKSAPAQSPAPESAWPVAFDANFPDVLKRQAFGDLDFAAGLRGDKVSSLHQKFFGPMQGSSYRRYFTDRISSFGAASATGAAGAPSCGLSTALACVMPEVDHTKMWITPNYSSLNLPQIFRVAVIFHEARHTEAANKFWTHIKCPTPFLDANGRDIKGIAGLPIAGLPACDDTPEGAYAVELVLLKNVADSCANCTGKVRMDAKFYVGNTMERIVGEPAVKTLRDDLY